VLHELTIWNERQNNIFIVPLKSGSAHVLRVGELRAWGVHHNVTVLGIRRNGHVTLNPKAEMSLQQGDEAVVMGSKRPGQIDLG
jgi:K+/H+ antiporter YhaU regulatory subunit KhtT